ncbi:hypothetical protein SAMN06296273_0388 [Nitrosomonas ureae]|uniref:Uncharacterized protein n=1 Tax=Nitrosomonas ureae TaxID=44577 RepID=A0A285BVK5_9PROT|nr:hypothetical protein [Nitrosomonas ureae]SNX58928.1 hypothetical protein SAMN06296273_0388 [Nitrosomonas ureae]
MGAIFFYIFIYFVGYYASNVLNMLTVRPFITNRYIAALLPVYGVALTHAYVIVSSPPPQSADMTVEYALLVFITLPVVVVTLGAVYFMWNSKGKQDDNSDENEFNNASKTSPDVHNGFTNQKAEIQLEIDPAAEEKITNHKNVEHNTNSNEKI